MKEEGWEVIWGAGTGASYVVFSFLSLGCIDDLTVMYVVSDFSFVPTLWTNK